MEIPHDIQLSVYIPDSLRTEKVRNACATLYATLRSESELHPEAQKFSYSMDFHHHMVGVDENGWLTFMVPDPDRPGQLKEVTGA